MQIIACLLLGIGIGILMRRDKPKWTERLTTAMVWLLLFSMGAGIGGNDELYLNVGSLGLRALAVGVMATLGSAIAAWALWENTDHT